MAGAQNLNREMFTGMVVPSVISSQEAEAGRSQLLDCDLQIVPDCKQTNRPTRKGSVYH